ncbi:ferredoxin [Streptomyces sp. NBC_01016]|uniref:ferredoxin n=1 Tax=Streptomyces sp. NBC_01016 TaxID=2903720 RepID=UPI00224CECAB|nr:ferredoxin [Streptomyces sp. NBC_01016]MCX4831234.1 ferredoxin [Streptomyces sp. NBC_01016]
MTDPQVVVDRERCLGTGICVVYAPATFAHDDEAKAVVIGPPEPLDELRTAVEGCPTQALRLMSDPLFADEEGR